MSYPALPKTYDEQLTLLKSRGLIIVDEAFAKRCLEHCNYYRLSIYWRRFRISENEDQFIVGTTFENAWELYEFDRKLRNLVWQSVKIIEISARSKWAYVVGHHHGALAYQDSSLFIDAEIHRKLLESLDEDLKRRRQSEKFLSHHNQKYRVERLETWKICEVLSFGDTSKFIKNLKDSKAKEAIAGSYEMSANEFCAILHHITTIRNIVAHHGRLWDRDLVFTLSHQIWPKGVNKSMNKHAPKRIYNTLVILMHLIRKIEPQNSFRNCLKEFVKNVPRFVRDEMGFPVDWETRKIWNF